jgi:hypothetical protein
MTSPPGVCGARRSCGHIAPADPRLFIYLFLDRLLQVLGDRYGHCVWLPGAVQHPAASEVIEGLPSPIADEGLRRAMGEQAVAIARGWLLQPEHRRVPWSIRTRALLEMNTRLQVRAPLCCCHPQRAKGLSICCVSSMFAFRGDLPNKLGNFPNRFIRAFSMLITYTMVLPAMLNLIR